MNLEGGARFLVLTFVFSWAEKRGGATRTFYIRNMFFYMTLGY